MMDSRFNPCYWMEAGMAKATKGHCWLGVCAGDHVPVARRSAAEIRMTKIDGNKEGYGYEADADGRFYEEPFQLETACRDMSEALARYAAEDAFKRHLAQNLEAGYGMSEILQRTSREALEQHETQTSLTPDLLHRTVWIEPMGFGDEPDDDGYVIAIDTAHEDRFRINEETDGRTVQLVELLLNSLAKAIHEDEKSRS